jgi:hypothetical protein
VTDRASPRSLRPSRAWLDRLSRSPWHPIAFALLPVVSILSHNVGETSPPAAVRPGILCLVIGLAVWGITTLVIRNRVRSGLVTSLFLMLFFSYGHVVSGFLDPKAFAFFLRLGLVGDRALLVGVWAGLFVLGSAILLRPKMPEGSLVQLFNILAFGALAAPVLTILMYEAELLQPWPQPDPTGGGIRSEAAGQEAPPDIYYIILDGFGGQEILADLYEIDLAPFYERMERLGFTIVSGSHSNYSQTALSLASSLNMTYLDFVAEQVGTTSSTRRPLPRLIRWNRLRQFLEDRGYRTIAFETGSRVTEWPDADLYLSPGRLPRTDLDRLVYESSALSLIPGIPEEVLDIHGRETAAAHRERVRFVFSSLRMLGEEPGPKFVFAHIISPHPPFLISRDGSDLPAKHAFTFNDGDAFPGSSEEYLHGYREQTAFVISSIETTIEAILALSPEPPVIIIQGDHGPGSRLTWDSPASADANERLSILNLIYLQDVGVDEIYDGMTPVNTFRIILNSVFGTRLALAPDRSYLSTWTQPYAWYPVDFIAESEGSRVPPGSPGRSRLVPGQGGVVWLAPEQ